MHSSPAPTLARLLAVSAACLTLAGCETTQEAPEMRKEFIERTYQIPVTVPALNGRYDKTRATASQQIIVQPGMPATFRARVDVRRAAEGAELKGIVRGRELFSIPALRMKAGDPAIPVVVALPVEARSRLVDIQIRMVPASAEAAFEILETSVTVGENAPAEIKVGEPAR